MWWFLAAIVAALLSLFGGQKTAPTAPAVTSAASGVTLAQSGTLSGFGLTPGHAYYASFAFTPDDGSAGHNEEWTALTVKPDGTVVFPETPADVDPSGKPGTLKAWLHDEQPFASPAATGPDGTALQTETHLP